MDGHGFDSNPTAFPTVRKRPRPADHDSISSRAGQVNHGRWIACRDGLDRDIRRLCLRTLTISPKSPRSPARTEDLLVVVVTFAQRNPKLNVTAPGS
jgi:hypothetical protein